MVKKLSFFALLPGYLNCFRLSEKCPTKTRRVGRGLTFPPRPPEDLTPGGCAVPYPMCPTLVQEAIMSKRNGDKARFGRQRIRKALLRKKARELRKELMGKTPDATMAASN
jgi:hypothetical protein